MTKIEEVIQTAITKVKPNCSEKDRENYHNVLSKVLDEGMSMREAMAMSGDTLEYLYGYAYRFYTTGNYKNASLVFAYLTMLDINNPKYFMAFAACKHRLKEYYEAINAYLSAFYLNVKDPLPFFHISDCYEKLNKPDYALFSLGMAIHIAGENPYYAKIKERALLREAAIQNELATAQKK